MRGMSKAEPAVDDEDGVLYRRSRSTIIILDPLQSLSRT